VSAYTYRLCKSIASLGHKVHVVTNADEVESDYRIWMRPGDSEELAGVGNAGGGVTVRSTSRWDFVKNAYIPSGNPTVTKLATLATEVIREESCEVIFAFYFEPYGVAAALASLWTGVPYVLKHAGSDRFNLMQNPETSLAYKEVVRSANAVVSSGVGFSGFNVPESRVFFPPEGLVSNDFTESVLPINLNGLFAELKRDGCPRLRYPKQIDSEIPTVLMYGKVGILKGTFDALAAIWELQHQEKSVQLLILGGGARWPSVEVAIEQMGIQDSVWRLPFLAPWHVPGVIRAVNAVAVLERDFEIKAHGPRVAAEVLACGVPLVCSAEIARKQYYLRQEDLTRVMSVVDDTKDPQALAGAISAACSQESGIGEAARNVPKIDESKFGSAYLQIFDRVVKREDVASTILIDSALEILRGRCPVTASVLEERRKFGNRWRRIAAKSSDSEMFMALKITEELQESSGSLSDFVKLESLLLWLDSDIEGVLGKPPFGMPVSFGFKFAELQVQSIFPVFSGHVKIEEFDFNVQTYIDASNDEKLDTCVRMQRDHLQAHLFFKRPELGGAVVRISGQTRSALLMCSGYKSLEHIAMALKVQPGSYGALISTFQRMHDLKVLGIARRFGSNEN
jgi:glycosyltransferase involved in cell wall biosynthesis